MFKYIISPLKAYQPVSPSILVLKTPDHLQIMTYCRKVMHYKVQYTVRGECCKGDASKVES